MMIILSAAAAIIPMTGYLYIIWKLDKNDREPLKYIIINFLWGAVGAVILASIGSLLLAKGMSFFIKDEKANSLLEAILIAPFIEETMKGLFLLIMINSRKFDNLTDGLVYGGAIGLGFGMTENFLYFSVYGTNLQSWLFLVFVRTSFSAVMHCISTATLGAFFAIAKFGRPSSRLFFPLLGLLIAIIIHFIWNLTVSFNFTAMLGFLFLVFIAAVFISVFLYSVHNENKIIFRELIEEVEMNLIPQKHLTVLSSNLKHRTGWISENIRKDYLRLLTTLAFRKVQLRNSEGIQRNLYLNEIELYRTNIRNLLNN